MGRLAFGITALAFACPLGAQTVAPSQVTPETLRPVAPLEEVRPILPSPEHQAVSGARLSVRMARVRIEGAFAGMADANAALKAAIENKRLTVAQIFAAARRLEEAYAEDGYTLARVTVPPQALTDNGTLRVVVIDGFIEAVDVEGVPERVRDLVLARTAAIAGRRHIVQADIERALLIAGDTAGLRLKSTLARGTQEGGTLLILEGRHQLVTGALGVNNTMPSSLGNWSRVASASLNSPFGYGEQFYVSGALGGAFGEMPDMTSPMRLFGTGLALPIGTDGWIINPEYTRSLTKPYTGADEIAEAGNFERVTVRASYPLIRGRARMLLVDGAVEHIYQIMEAPDFDTELSKDRYTALRAGGVLEDSLPWGAGVRLAAHLSHGLGGRGIAEAAASNIPLSRQEAEPVFTKANAEARFTQPLWQAFRLEVLGRAQSSFGEALLRPEQFALDGSDAVTARPDYPFIVDEGASLRAELSRVFPVQAGMGLVALAPYGFGAAGWGRLDAPTLLEIETLRLAALGIGVRATGETASGETGATFALEVARLISNDLDAAGWRVQFNSGVRF